MTASAEVIVVGAGHNGLIAAAYLARSGFDTLLIESRSSVGAVIVIWVLRLLTPGKKI